MRAQRELRSAAVTPRQLPDADRTGMFRTPAATTTVKPAEASAPKTGEPEDLELSPINQLGGLGKAHQLFGEQLPKLLEELNNPLAA